MISVLTINAGAPTYTYNFGQNFTLDGATGTAGFADNSVNAAQFNFSGAAVGTFGSATVNVSPVNLGASTSEHDEHQHPDFWPAAAMPAASTIGLAGGTTLNVTGTGTGGSATVNSNGGTINISGATGGVSFGSPERYERRWPKA